MKILDYLGQVFNPKTINKGQRQTTNAVALTESFATHPIRGITPASLSTLLEDAEKNNMIVQSELFVDIEERDPHIYAELSKRKRTVIGLPKRILPPKDPTPQETEALLKITEAVFNIPDLDDMLLDLLDGIGYGFSCVELTWGNVNGIWVPIKCEHRPQSWFQTDLATRSIISLINKDDANNGEPLWPFGWIVHKHFAKSGYLARAGLFRVLAWPWLMKQYSLRDLAEYLEIYGLPIKIGKYPRSIPEEDKDNLQRAIQQLGRSVSGIMPDDMNIEFLKESLGSSDPFMGMINYCDETISRAILGQTLSSSTGATGMGSGVATLHGDVRQDLLEADAAQLASTLTKQLVYPIMALNNWYTGRDFVFSFDTSTPNNLNLFADSIQKLVAAGVPISAEWVRKSAGIPEPTSEEEIIGGTVTNANNPTSTTETGATDVGAINANNTDTPAIADNNTNSKAALKSAYNFEITTYPDAQVKRLDKEMSPLINAVLLKAKGLLDDSTTMEEFESKLLDWFPEAEALDMSAILENAFAATELAGRYEVDTDG